MLATKRLPCFRAASMRLMCPACRLPMVGTNPTRSCASCRRETCARTSAIERVVFVPTMGNLHAGHMSLIEAARKHGKRFVASIFVNPMQFGPNEDFAHYPRTPTQDSTMLQAAGCDLMFSPEVGEIYPNGADQATRVEVPGISRILCGEFR